MQGTRGIRGLVWTVRSLGPLIALKEIARRLFGLEYDVKGVRIRDNETFRTIRDLMASGLKVEFTQKEVVVYTSFGSFKVNKEHVSLLSTLLEDFDTLYGQFDYGGKLVVDIGAFIGDASLYF